jgi:YesN/AraC family two-component response regulator
MLRYLLEFDGYKVVEASNGEEALDLLANEPVSILITDVCMPSMDGLELLKHLRDGRAIVPHIIAMSGFLHFAPIAEAAAASLAEVDFVLDKPFSRVDLLKALSHTDPKGSSNELT